ncbi:flagellin [Conexibacter sp. JD483]|uniref:flagellin N-terminal helical domain-containing protein n=1 Tax=unclassified Conexibacter TaxID=2627773 RepID=UPI00271AB3D8|nr:MULTISPECIES: flagellin [unclassified Conexibacter]MDO8188229.1 flagellin [Conexibacter sp. CPCC 205706]MDO8201896.1 flagellin [Conexibacter sp. CPCC 205762]MDR9370805.1 flagellin [Conexibacter sp. JD483]
MSLRINTNVEAFNAHRNLEGTSNKLAKSMERLSSGFRINRAADDAAGLAISEKLRGQIGGLDQARRNVQDGISLVQTAEGSLTEVHSMLQRSRELAVQWQNGTLAREDRAAIVSEVAQLDEEIRRIQSTSQFNGIRLLDTAAQRITFQVGANDRETITVQSEDLNARVGAIDITRTDSLSRIDTMINNVSDLRSNFGAVQNRLEHTYNNLSVYQENLSASESRIRDVDMAAEMVNFTKNNILQQAGTSMLAQAQQAPQAVLSLLR